MKFIWIYEAYGYFFIGREGEKGARKENERRETSTRPGQTKFSQKGTAIVVSLKIQ
jgi:hypothetical protein